MRKKKRIIILSIVVLFVSMLVIGWFQLRKIYPTIIGAGLRPLGNILVIPIVSYSLLAQLFGTDEQNYRQREVLQKMSKDNYSAAESIVLGNALLIKEALKQHVQFYKKLPEDLNLLNLDKKTLQDSNGSKLRYIIDSTFVLLGSCGENGKWDINLMDKATILNIKSNFVYKVKDDFFVGFEIDIPQSTN